MAELKEPKVSKPNFLNAFELISFSSGLNLSGLFETTEVCSLCTMMIIHTCCAYVYVCLCIRIYDRYLLQTKQIKRNMIWG